MIPMLVILAMAPTMLNVKQAAGFVYGPNLRIGILNPNYLPEGGGPYSPGSGGTYDGASMAAKEINNAGGVVINSTTHENITLDFQDEGAYSPSPPFYSTGTTDTSMSEMLGSSPPTPNDQFIIGGFRTETTEEAESDLAVWNTAGNNPVPMIICGSATTAEINGTDTAAGLQWVFRITPVNDNYLFGTVAGYIQQSLAPQLAAMYTNATYPTATPGQVRFAVICESYTWTAAIEYALTTNGVYQYFLGTKLTTSGVTGSPNPGEILVDPLTEDFVSLVSTLKSENVHLIIDAFTMPEVDALIHQMAVQNMQAMLVGIDVPGQQQSHWSDTGGTPTTQAQCNYEVNLLWSGTNTPIINVPAPGETGNSTAFWNNFLTFTAGESWNSGKGCWPMYTAAGAYDAVYQIAAAIQWAGTTDTTVKDPITHDSLLREGIAVSGNPGAPTYVFAAGLSGEFMYDPYGPIMGPFGLVETTNDAFSMDTSLNWTQFDGTNYGFARSMVVQWVQNTAVPPAPFPDVGAQMNVLSPTQLVNSTSYLSSLPYARKTLIPPSMYSLAAYDVNFDGKVDIKDVHAVATAYGTYAGGPGYVLNYDVNVDGKIDIKDVHAVAAQYGQHAPTWPLP